MTFLSRFEINAARRGAQALMASPQRLHAAVMAAYPAADHEAEGRILWRLDSSAAHRWLYILSPAEPDLTHLVEQAGWPTKPHWDTRDYSPLLDKLGVGQRWTFRLCANPTHLVTDNGRRRRYGHVTIAQKTAWLLDRAESLGISIPQSTAEAPDVVVTGTDQRSFPRDGCTVTLTVATYNGTLRVADPTRLRTALLTGVGRGKAYGCGLMTLARP